TYQVNALGQRFRKTNSSDDRVFLYDTQGHLIAETTPAGTLIREYLYLGDMPLATADQTSSATALVFTTTNGSLVIDTASHRLTLTATGLPTVSTSASSWSAFNAGSWQFVNFSGKDAQNRQLSGEYASLGGVPQSAYVTMTIPAARNESYNLAGD